MSTITRYENVTIFQSALYMTNSLVAEMPDAVLIVDPCWLPEEVAGIRCFVDSLPSEKPRYLLFTHSDFDHIIGYRAFPGAKVIGDKLLTEKAPEAMDAILEQIRKFDDDYYLVRDYPIEYPELDLAVDRDGMELKTGNSASSSKLTFFASPGHCDDGIITVLEPGGILIAGDYLSDIEFPFIYHDAEAYLATLDKLEAILDRHDIKLLVPGHGHATQDPNEMRKRIANSRSYIQRAREALAAGDEAAYAAIIEGCPFPRNMKKFHEHNRKLLTF